MSRKLYDNTETLEEVLELLANKAAGGGGGENKLASVIDKTITELTAEDLENVTSIGSYAFYDCRSLTSVVVPDNVIKIDKYAFANCDILTSVFISNSVTSIGNSAFSRCSNLSSVIIPNSVTSIGENAFYYCTSLVSVAIPSGVSSIKWETFRYCRKLRRIDFSTHTSVPTLENTNALDSMDLTNLQIKVPANLIDSWKTVTNWSNYASKIVTEFTNEL